MFPAAFRACFVVFEALPALVRLLFEIEMITIVKRDIGTSSDPCVEAMS